ncbi:IS66 family transposase [Moraxella osloensis]|uniref:IS66 family transposase n=1 Tax=Faucicola osloensis TaxID=34062 RepID=A0A2D2LWB8_FAUOS|nr:IS66 family transposase [Moraxella osloensis]ATR79303.1 IS66 family transposase [Moraxella osloensis]ATR79507.1 IS66 family transposase [Moraxella osloensis]ATR79837.1 IS66 family transposase [Moraxella osloensis]ATR80042.1 IS66 family transposase [Moraxella osloensis]ATR80101.1 IS66 family transposase [Moraxella osloensis]
MTTAHPSDPTAPSYADLLAQNAQLQQQLDAQKQHYQQQAAQLKQQYQQQMDAQRQQYEAKLARINQALIDAIAKQQRLIHRLFGQKSEGLTPKQDHLNKETALEDLALLEQAHDNFLAKLSDDERAKLPASKPIDTQEKGTQSETPTKPKRQKRLVIPDNLDIHTIVHEPATTTCECGCQMTQMGQDVQDKLGFKPKQFYRERHVYPKYTCRNAACNCERLVQAKTEPQIIDKSVATPALLAHILISKYADHLPLYRQSLIYQRSGVYLSDSTLADWVGRCGVQLGFLVNRLRQMILTQPILHADETPVKVLNGYGMKDAKGKLKQGYVWAYVTPKHSPIKAVVYDFAQGRGSEYPNTFLQGFKGKLVCDGYNGYKPLFGRGVIEVGCMAHARRKFHELHVTGQSLISIEALELFQTLYTIEREIDERFEKNQSPIPRDAQIVRQIRQQKAKPVADKLYAWLQQKRLGTTKNAAITKAIEYCLKRWQALTRYLDDGNLPIDNNWAENQMRPWALGRKNWLFAGSLESGQRAANVMSLVQSARLNGIDPYAYLADVLRRLPTHKDKDIDELLPHVWKPPQ